MRPDASCIADVAVGLMVVERGNIRSTRKGILCGYLPLPYKASPKKIKNELREKI